jgi:autotransporter translocation and assembly factor TamB
LGPEIHFFIKKMKVIALSTPPTYTTATMDAANRQIRLRESHIRYLKSMAAAILDQIADGENLGKPEEYLNQLRADYVEFVYKIACAVDAHNQ